MEILNIRLEKMILFFIPFNCIGSDNSSTPTALISVSNNAIVFGEIEEMNHSESQILNVQATNFEISLDDTKFTSELSISDFDGTIALNGSLWGTTAAEGWQANTTYYWKVTATNTAGSTESPIWSFTTGAADPLGVEDFTIEALSVSPNPVKNVITINSPVGFDSVEVYNQLGQLVLESNSSLMNNNRLDLSALNPGMSLIQINADNKSKTVKIIKE